MTLVVADSGPIRYLVVIGAIDLLPRLYSLIVLPTAVIAELTHPHAPSPARAWATSLPSWVEVRGGTSQPSRDLEEILDTGEVAAITLAHEIRADLVLLDDREGRKIAIASGLRISGTIGVLEAAAEMRLINLKEYFGRLQETVKPIPVIN
jgi:predicted nucleic acid-binding protein